MSYIERAVGFPNFEKALASVWFRVPQKSIDATNAEGGDELSKILPLFTFGKGRYPELIGTPFSTHHVNLNENPGPGPEQPTGLGLQTFSYTTSTIGSLDPCYVGINCSTRSNPLLVVNLQTDTKPVVTNYSLSVISFDVWSGFDSTAPHSEFGVDGSGVNAADFEVFRANGYVDDSWIDSLNPEKFFFELGEKIIADRWHHLVFSFDLSNTLTATQIPYDPLGPVFGPPNTAQQTSGAMKFWIALDDVNYSGYDISDEWVDGAGQNDFTTPLAQRIAGLSNFRLFQNLFSPPAQYRWAPNPAIKVLGQPFGFPAAARYVDKIKRVEMAEFEMYTGITRDTGLVSTRRLFVDGEGKPVKPKVRLKALGVEPNVTLHRSGNWKRGNNTGILTDDDFEPTGKIVRYKPDPSLNGPQGDPI